MGFLKTELVKTHALVHLLQVQQALLPLLEQITFVNRVLLICLSPFKMNVYGMEKGALLQETHAVHLIPHHTLLDNCKHPQVRTSKDDYVAIKVEIMGVPVL